MPADPAYNRYVGENVLSDEDVALFETWYNTGMAYGDESVVVTPPELVEGSLWRARLCGGFCLHPAVGWRGIPVVCGVHRLEETKYIQAVEVIPGLPGAVHHADIFVDTTGESAALDESDPLPSSTGPRVGPPTTASTRGSRGVAGPVPRWGHSRTPGRTGD